MKGGIYTSSPALPLGVSLGLTFPSEHLRISGPGLAGVPSSSGDNASWHCPCALSPREGHLPLLPPPSQRLLPSVPAGLCRGAGDGAVLPVCPAPASRLWHRRDSGSPIVPCWPAEPLPRSSCYFGCDCSFPELLITRSSLALPFNPFNISKN